jgi:hypothetical protein
MLTQLEAVPYLLQTQLVSADSFVNGDLAVEDASRRSRNFKVISEHAPSYLLKQGIGPDGSATISHEAAIYELFWSDTAADELRCYLPRFYKYDSREHLLVLEFLRNAQDVKEYHTHRKRFSTAIASAMGKALGTLHSLMWREGKTSGDMEGLAYGPPWVLSLHHPAPRIFWHASSANVHIIKIIQQFPEFCALLDSLFAGWRIETFIHFDLRWDNWLVMESSDRRQKPGLKIVDWELAGRGDPCWDIGSVFSEYLSFWLLSIPVSGDIPPDRFPELARYPLSRMQPAIRSFWDAYVQRMNLDASRSHEWLLRSMKYAAARLVQTAFERMQIAMQLTGNTVCFLQLSLNILQQPEEAIVHLLGIPLQGMRPR